MASDYQVQFVTHEDVGVVRLIDTQSETEVTIAPAIGNMAVSFKVHGHEILYLPTRSLKELQAHPALGGVPFLAPWANRISGNAFWANGKKYQFNMDLGNLRLDQHRLPIHGLLSFSPLWQVSESGADGDSAHVTSRIEYFRYPDLMAQFPFAHTIEMTYRLQNGVLQVETLLRNRSAEPMPVGIGFHPYFQLDDAPRDEWTAHIDAREHVTLNSELTPTGEVKPLEMADPYPLRGNQLDDVFSNLVRDSSGHATFWVRGKNQQIAVIYGPHYPVAVAYAPPGKSFICFEPMAGLTNAFNLAHEGKFKDLQSVPAGGEWRESFWIRPTGF